MTTEREVRELIEGAGGTVQEIGRLPDGSGFATGSFPLPKDHWLYVDEPNNPPMPWKIGTGPDRDELARKIRNATMYAVRASTMNGKDMDFDPDAMVQNMIVGMLGYWTRDGSCSG